MNNDPNPLGRAKATDVSAAQPTLYIVATPIGTLADFSPRARDTLEKVDFIACEDTRRTKELLAALQLRHGPLVSLHEHNERVKSDDLVERLLKGEKKTAALVSDAGTPAISDPGALMVDACHAAGIRVESIPGPSSMVAAVAASGFLRPRVMFSGFLSRNANDQQTEFQLWRQASPCVAVCFESPNRVLATLKNMQEVFPGSVVVSVSREISKKFEEHIRGPLEDVIQNINARESLKGECVICVDVGADLKNQPLKEKLTFAQVTELVHDELNEHPELRVKDVCKKFAEQHGLNTKELYNAVIGNRRS